VGAVETEGTGRHVTSQGVLFEKFEIISCLKQDEYSSVYLARHIYLGKNIILKALCTQRIPDTVLVDRFKREARILARLDHPNIIKVLDFGTYKEYFYISFEYFESSNLRHVLGRQNLAFSQRREIFIDLLEAIRYAHSEGIIHRDIKPENILVNEALEVKLSDFGLAQMHTDSLVTDKLGLVGTPSYMSPEQIQGDVLTPQSDLFSCGIVACELFLNIHPFLGRDVNESLNAIISFDEEKIGVRLQPLPEDLRNVVAKLLRKKPGQRWENASAVLEALGAKINAAPVGKRSAQSRQFSRPLIIAAMIIVVLIGAVTIYLTRRNDLEVATPASLGRDTSGFLTKKADSIRIPAQEPKTNPERPLTKENIENKGQENRSAAILATQKKNTSESEEAALPAGVRYGELFVACLPWAQVSIDSVNLDTTPLKNNLRLPVGRHQIELTHPNYPVYRSTISILAGEITMVKVNLDTLFGFLAFNVYPWGEIYIDGRYIDRTPMKPFRLAPGAHRVTVKNAELGTFEKQVVVQQHDTLWIQYRYGLQQ
jgi:serine/threonine-protein kinase